MSQTDSSSHRANPYPPAYSPPPMAGAHGGNMQYSSYPEGQASPHLPGAIIPSLNLPPLRSIDNRTQQAPPQQHQHPGPAQSIPFYQPYPIPPPTDHNVPIRYPLPPNPDGRLMSGGRHKKEIKRRTKTGCLTCRKRRIKCDEGHPACRNCQKSKRECLGYDPIFKPQPGTTQLQPASQQYSSMAHASSTSYPPPPSQAYSPASYGAPVIEGDSSTSASGNAIDPSLDGTAQEDEGLGDVTASQADRQVRRAKRTKIEDLLCINGISPPPPAPPSPLPDTTRQEITHIYNTAYAPGMDKFLETRWFSERGVNHLLANSILCDQFANLVQRYAMNLQDPNYYVHLGITQSLEAMVVWSMLGMCRAIASKKDDSGHVNEEEVKEGVLDAAKRLEIFETLVTGRYMSGDSAPQASENKHNGTPLHGQLKSREQEFWRSAHTFLTIHDGDTDSARATDEALSTCRGLLENRENRDVIYSIMIVRHLGAHTSGFPNEIKQPETNDERDSHAKLAVAKKLVEDEAGGKGTNQVVQRLCGVAARSWALK